MVLGDRPAPPSLSFFVEWPQLAEGGLELLHNWVREHSTKLLIIDTLARLKGLVKPKADAYHADYALMQGFKKLADKNRCSVLLIHHESKKGSGSDPFARFSGSIGITGAADALLSLTRNRGSDEAILRVTGRDTEDHEIQLRFIKDKGSFEVTDETDATQIFLSPERREILAFIQACSEPVGPKVVSEALGMPYASVRRSMPEMLKKQKVLRRIRGGYRAADTLATTATTDTPLPDNVLPFPTFSSRDLDDEITH